MSGISYPDRMDQLSGLWSLSPIGALVGFIVILGTMIARGQLVTRREVEARIAAVEAGHKAEVEAITRGNDNVSAQQADRIEDYKGREATLTKRGDDWKDALQTERQVSAELLRQNGALVDSQQTTRHLIQSIPVFPQNGGHTDPVESS